ncbi:MAG: phosphoribosylanthranilate isomerase [Eubacterium sp.]|nr:phosphoribosylanthranilate isomerase [Eubacterium sp.]
MESYVEGSTKIKFCGLRTTEDVEYANELRPDYVGFVFAKNSKRMVTERQAELLKSALEPGIIKVGVFVREDPERIANLLHHGTIDYVQLHGGEDTEYIRKLRKLTDHPIIQAFRVDTKEDLAAAEKSEADYILLDSGTGGTGTAFNWELLKGFSRPYFLAGGLSPENVREAIETLHPYVVDVSSGIETDGRKDPAKMEKFIDVVRSTESE